MSCVIYDFKNLSSYNSNSFIVYHIIIDPLLEIQNDYIYI